MAALRSFFLNEEPSAPVELDTRESAASMNAMLGLLTVVTLIVVFGLTMLYSASYGTDGYRYFRSQLIWAAIGGAGGFVAFLIGYRKLASWSVPLMGIVFLLLVVAFFSPAIKGANRWIVIPGVSMRLQPSELAKIAVALFMAKYCSENIRTFNNLRGRRGVLPLIAIAGAVICGILAGRDFGTTALVLCVAVAIAVVAGLRWYYLAVPGALVTLAGLYVFFFDAVRLSRVTTFLRPEETSQEGGYQLWTSLLAFGSGGWTGVGFMESRLKQDYLPEQHTDFILSIVGEELGLAGMLAVLALYTLFTWYGFRICVNSRSRLGMLLGCGLTLGITLQAVINIAVVTGSVPTKGMPAAFVSYGGSNIMACLTAVGILASIAFDNVCPNYNMHYWNSIRAKLSFLPWFRRFRKSGEES